MPSLPLKVKLKKSANKPKTSNNRAKKGKVIIISGPSGSGKTTLYKKLLRSPKLKNRLVKSISVTTRKRREGEQNGRDYFFVSEKMFLYKKRNGQFLESEKNFENYYGTPRANVEKLRRQGKNVLLCIDVKGAKVVKRKISEAIMVFIKTPSLKVLESRLLRRGSETRASAKLRLETARKELKESKHYDHIFINDNLAYVFSKLQKKILEIIT